MKGALEVELGEDLFVSKFRFYGVDGGYGLMGVLETKVNRMEVDSNSNII